MKAGISKLAAGVALGGALMAGLAGCDPQSLPDVSQLPFMDKTPSVAEGLAASTASDASLTAPTIREDGVLTVGIDADASLAPMCISGSDDSISGIDIDLASAIADQLDLKVKFVSIVGTDDATANSCDIVMNVSPESVSDSTVVGSYAESASAFFHKGDEGTVTVADLTGKKVGVQSGSVSERALSKTGLDMTKTPYTNLNEAFEALEAGEIDYVLCDAYAGAFLAHGYTDLAFAGTLDMPATRGIAVASSNTELQTAIQQALDEVLSNGSYEAVRARWIGAFPTLTTDQQIVDIPEAESSTEDSEETDSEETEGSDSDSTEQTPDEAGSNAVTL